MRGWAKRTVRALRRLAPRCLICEGYLSFVEGEYDDGTQTVRAWCTTCMVHGFECVEGDPGKPHDEYKLKGGVDGCAR